MSLCHGNRGFNFKRISCIICYYGTQIVEIFHTDQLSLSYYNVY
jgi:hypothetical protein